MAKVVDQVSMFLTSATTEYAEDSVLFEYRVTDGDLSKYGRWEASGLDFGQTVSGLWNEAITSIETLEGI